jgi:hypothetical protein
MTHRALSRERFSRRLRRARETAATATIALAAAAVAALLTWHAAAGSHGRQSWGLAAHPAHGAIGASAEADEAPPPASADLEDCSPFYSFAGTEELDFEDGVVVETREDAGSPPSRDRRAEKRRGTFAVDDASARVRITVGKTTRDFTLVVPTDSDQCVLAAGPANAADLQRSWFGELDDDPEVDRPTVQHASLRTPRAQPPANG